MLTEHHLLNLHMEVEVTQDQEGTLEEGGLLFLVVGRLQGDILEMMDQGGPTVILVEDLLMEILETMEILMGLEVLQALLVAQVEDLPEEEEDHPMIHC